MMTDNQEVSITFRNIHNRFRLNGTYFSRERLRLVACSYIKEGEPYEQQIGEFLLDWLDDDETLTVYTSGSTGKPKAIKIRKQQMVNSAIATGNFFGITVGDTALSCLPADYIAGKMMLVRAMILGLEIDTVKPVSNPLQNIKKHYNFSAMTPMQVQNSVTELDRIGVLIIGGAPVSAELKAALKKTGCKAYETYGMTETVTHIAARRINSRKKAGEEPAFRLLPGVQVSCDKRQCLVIDAPHLADDKVITNDLVELLPGKRFRWLGRYDHVVNSGGIKLIPEQIEQKLREVITGRFYVMGIPDDKLGEKLVLFVEEKTNPGSTEGEIKKKIDRISSLDKYERPKEVHCIKTFKETKSGKVLRKSEL